MKKMYQLDLLPTSCKFFEELLQKKGLQYCSVPVKTWISTDEMYRYHFIATIWLYGEILETLMRFEGTMK